MRVRILGGISVVADDRVEPVSAPRQRLLLAVLATRAGSVVDDSTLADAIWGVEAPRSARTALQTYVSALRDLLEPDRARRSDGAFIAREGNGYTLCADALDATRFEHLVASARDVHRDDPEAAIALLDEAEALWADPPFAEFADEWWAVGAATRLRDLHGASLESRFGLALELGDETPVIARLEAAAEAYPYRERLAGQLMLALYRSGQQQRALAHYEATRRRLVEDLGLDPGRELQLLERAIIAQDPALRARGRSEPDAAVVAAPIRSTHPPRLVGRDRDVKRVLDALDVDRCVSIVGPGGVGKTSVAAVVAASLDARRDGHLHHVELADSGGRDVLRSVAAALRVVEHPLAPLTESILDSVGDAPAVVVIETCEVAVDEVAHAVTTLLRSPSIRVLLTSQVPVGVPGELVVRLGPLEPEAAVEILRRAAGDDRLDRAVLDAIADRVERLPLGLELAAARVTALGAAELLRQLDGGPALLTGSPGRPERQRSLRATVEWSLDHLDDGARRQLGDLATLTAPFTLDVAARLHAADATPGADRHDPVAGVVELVDRSLLVRVDVDPPRFRVPDMVRHVALERSRPEHITQARTRTAELVLESAQARLFSTTPSVALEDLAGEVVPALHHFDTLDDPRQLLLAGMLGTFFTETGRISEGREQLGRALDRHAGAHDVARAMATAQLGFLAWYQGDLIATKAALREILAVQHLLGDFGTVVGGCVAFVERRYDEAAQLLGAALDALGAPTKQMMLVANMAGNAAWYAADLSLALHRYRCQREAAREAGDRFNIAQALRFEAMVTAQLGDIESAWRWAERSRTMAAEMADPVSLAQSFAACAAVAETAGAHTDARADAIGAIDASRRHFDVFALRTAVPIVAASELRSGGVERSARLAGWYLDLLERTGQAASPAAATVADQTLAAAREHLGPVAFARLAGEGAASKLADLVAPPNPAPSRVPTG